MNEFRPMNIQFEGLSRCNASCTFCPYTDMKRQKGEMSEELFHKIVKEGKKLKCKSFSPFLNGEPFLDPKIFNWLDYMEKEGVWVSLYTNCSLLNKEKIDRLLKYKNIVQIVCSINAATKETHEKLMHLKNFDEIVENVKYLLSKNPYFRVMCSMALLEENKHECADFKRMWGRRHTRIAQFVNWAGYKHNPIEALIPKEKHFCHHLKNMYVLWDGRVCLCCMDYDGKVITGNLNTQTVKEVWDNSKWIRDKQLEGKYDELELCKDCNLNCNKVVRY